MSYERLVGFVLRKYGLSKATFKLISIEEEWRPFLIGHYFFEHLGDETDSLMIEGRMIEEYGFNPQIKEIMERCYVKFLGIEDKNLIKKWLEIHEINKKGNPEYIRYLAPFLDVFFKYIKKLLNCDFLIVYNPQKLKKFFRKKKDRRMAIVEEVLHYCYMMNRNVPIEHNEVSKLSKKILKEYHG